MKTVNKASITSSRPFGSQCEETSLLPILSVKTALNTTCRTSRVAAKANSLGKVEGGTFIRYPLGKMCSQHLVFGKRS